LPACGFLDVHLAEFGAMHAQRTEARAADDAIHGILHDLKASAASEKVDFEIVQVGVVRAYLSNDAILGAHGKQDRSDRGDILLGRQSHRETDRHRNFGVRQHGNRPSHKVQCEYGSILLCPMPLENTGTSKPRHNRVELTIFPGVQNADARQSPSRFRRGKP
jgi:hypothetical protein